MGAGYEALPLSLPMTAFPSIFLPSNKEDSVKKELQQTHNGSIIGTDLLRMTSKKKSCVAGTCERKHAQHTLDTLTNKSVKAISPTKGRLQGQLPLSKQPGHVPLNKDNQRLDLSLTYPRDRDFLEFANRFPRTGQQPCNWHHLANSCRNGTSCPWDHADVNDKMLTYMQFRMRFVPCANGGECRWSDCIFGHVCHSKKCVGKAVKTCPLNQFHHVDPTTVQWVKGADVGEFIAHDVTIDQPQV